MTAADIAHAAKAAKAATAASHRAAVLEASDRVAAQAVAVVQAASFFRSSVEIAAAYADGSAERFRAAAGAAVQLGAEAAALVLIAADAAAALRTAAAESPAGPT